MNDIVGLIKFILILDNSGQRIYTRYYDKKLDTIESQKELEKKICSSTDKLNVYKNDVDIFNLNEYLIISNISNEVAIFIGADEDDNEVLLSNFYDIFEKVILNIIQNGLSRERLLNNYEELIIAVDEMVNNGIVMNCDAEAIDDNISLRNEVKPSSGYFSFVSPAPQKESNSIFGKLMSGAKNYLSKTVNN